MTAAPSSPARGRPVSQMREGRRGAVSFHRRRSASHGSTGAASTPGSGSPAQPVGRASPRPGAPPRPGALPRPGAPPRPPAAVPARGSVQRPAAAVLRSSNRKRPGETGTARSRQRAEGATREPAVGSVGSVGTDRVERRAARTAGLGRPAGFHKASPGARLWSPAPSGAGPSVEAPVWARRPVGSAASLRAGGASPSPVPSSVPAHPAWDRTFATPVGRSRTEPSTPFAGHRLALSRNPPWGIASTLLTRPPIGATPMRAPAGAPGRQLPTEAPRLAAQSPPVRPGSAQTGASSPAAVTAAAASAEKGVGASAWSLLRRATVGLQAPSTVGPSRVRRDGTPTQPPIGGHAARSIRPPTRYVVHRRAHVHGDAESLPPRQLSDSSRGWPSGSAADWATGGPSTAAAAVVPPRPKSGGGIWARRRTGMARQSDAVRRFHSPAPLASSLQARSVGDGTGPPRPLASPGALARYGWPGAGEPAPLATPARPSPGSGFALGAVAHGAPWHSSSSSARRIRQRPGASSPAVVTGAAGLTASAGNGVRASPWSLLRRATVRRPTSPAAPASARRDATSTPSPIGGHGRSSSGLPTQDLPQHRVHLRGDANSSTPPQLADSLPRSSSSDPAAPPARGKPSSANAAVVPPLRKGGRSLAPRRAGIARRSDVARWSHRPAPLATVMRARSASHQAEPRYRPMGRREVPLMPGGPFPSVLGRSAPGQLPPPVARAHAPTAAGARAWPPTQGRQGSLPPGSPPRSGPVLDPGLFSAAASPMPVAGDRADTPETLRRRTRGLPLGRRPAVRPARAATETAVPEGKILPNRNVRRSPASTPPGRANRPSSAESGRGLRSPWSAESGQGFRSLRAPSPLASSRWPAPARAQHQPRGGTAGGNRISILQRTAPARGELRAGRSSVPASGNESAHRPAGRAGHGPHRHQPGPQRGRLPAPGPLPVRTPPPSGVAGLPVGGAMALAGRLQRAAVATTVPPVVGSSEPGTAAAGPAAVAAHRSGAKATVGVPSVQRRRGPTLDDRASVPPLPPVPGPAGPEPATAAAPSRRNGHEAEHGDGLDHLVDRVVEALEDRVLGELERRGGRFLGAF